MQARYILLNSVVQNTRNSEARGNSADRQPSAVLNMVEALVIIVALGGLEFVLWFLDHKQQRKQIELLDSIWAELAIRNSLEEEQVVFRGELDKKQ